MRPDARAAAAIAILDRVIAGDAAERALTGWARGARYAGSGDRAAVRDLVFDGLRRRRSAAVTGGGSDTAADGRAILLGLVRQRGGDPAALFTGAVHAPDRLSPAEQAGGAVPDGAAAVDLPDWLWPLWQADLGARATQAALALRDRAPVFLRVNLARGDRDAARAALAAEGIATRPHDCVRTALEVNGNARKIQNSAAYREGLVELQDASSQAAVLRLPLAPGAHVLDFCAGGGGKALAIAALTGGPVTAHDADPGRMADLPARAARAGARIEIAPPDALRGSFDLVLADAPCSGSGTWRRAPDAKWRLAPEGLDALTRTQDAILRAAAGFVAPGGWLAYATCSVLRAENDDRIRDFRAALPGWKQTDEMRLWPGPSGDGFYLALLQRE